MRNEVRGLARVISKRSLSITNHKRTVAVPARNRPRRQNCQIASHDNLCHKSPSNAGEVNMDALRSTTAFGRLPWREASSLVRFDPDPRIYVRRDFETPKNEKPFFAKRTERVRAAPTEIAFGPFRLLPTQFLLLEGDKPVSLGSRALEILNVLLERPGELISKQELMDRVW